jgi:hypothetical protein
LDSIATPRCVELRVRFIIGLIAGVPLASGQNSLAEPVMLAISEREWSGRT